jgi:hypothetical protein
MISCRLSVVDDTDARLPSCQVAKNQPVVSNSVTGNSATGNRQLLTTDN